MAVHASSLLDDASPVSPVANTTPPAAPSPGKNFAAVLDAALDPALAMCTKMGELRPVAWDRWVFEVNCLGAAKSALDGFGFATERREKLEAREAEVVELLTGEHVSQLCNHPHAEPAKLNLMPCPVPARPPRGRPRPTPRRAQLSRPRLGYATLAPPGLLPRGPGGRAPDVRGIPINARPALVAPARAPAARPGAQDSQPRAGPGRGRVRRGVRRRHGRREQVRGEDDVDAEEQGGG